MTKVMPTGFNAHPKIKNKGIIRANYAQSLVTIPAFVASAGILGLMRKVSKISKEDSSQLNKAAQEGLRRTGLYKKGVRICKMTEKTIKKPKDFIKALSNLTYNEKDKSALSALAEELKSSSPLKKLFNNNFNKERQEKIIEYIAKIYGINFKLGLNACFLPHANKIIVPNKSLKTSVFHEMGHAMNANGGIFMKALQNCRPLAKYVPSAVLLISLLNKRKTTDAPQTNDTKGQKVANFIKKNAGKITALSFLPMVAEEGIATLRGQKVAKKLVNDGLLSKKLLKKIKLINLSGFSTYALAAVTMGLATKLAINVKDKIQAKYEAKKMAKFQEN